MLTGYQSYDRTCDKVTAFYHGRRVVPNTSPIKWTDNVRNACVAAGAVVGLSEVQRPALLKGFSAENLGGKPCLSVALPLLFCIS
jgi:hypothetical protein